MIRRLPFGDSVTAVTLATGESVPILPHQIILWAGITSSQSNAVPDDLPPFPIVLDTGFSDEFLIQQGHIENWAGRRLSELPMVDRVVKIYDNLVVTRAANLWIFPNVAGSRDRLPDSLPCRLRCDVSVCPPGTGRPRLPLLGMRAIDFNRMTVRIFGGGRYVSINKPG
jgi:hypothetical protein